MTQISLDDEIAEGINSLNSKQREVFNMVDPWTKDCVKYNEHNVEPVHVFLSGSGGIHKYQLVKVAYNSVLKRRFITVKTQKKQEFFYLGLKEYQL